MKETSNFLLVLIFFSIAFTLAGCCVEISDEISDAARARIEMLTSDMITSRFGSSPINNIHQHIWAYLDKFGNEPKGYASYSYILTGRDGLEKYTELVKRISFLLYL